MAKKKQIVFTDCDIDGAGSYLVWSWLTGKRVPYKVCRVNDFAKIFRSWYDNNNMEEYSVYIFDLDTSQDPSILDLIDRPNVTIIDHHKTHIEKKDVYTKANVVLREYTSCTRLIYSLFKSKLNEKLSPEQKVLILMIDDYDCYELKIPCSHDLNIIFWNYQGDRLDKFLLAFEAGFTGFNAQQKNIIKFYQKKLENIKKKLDVHIATIPVGSKKYKFVSVFADSCINEVAEYIINNYKSDVGLVINLSSNKVSLRKSKQCTLNLGRFAEKLFDQGGGHDYAAGGIVNDDFATFSKLFTSFGSKGLKVGK